MIISSQVWTDQPGNTRITLIRTNTGVGPILAALAPLTNAGLVECWEGPQSLYTPAPVAAQYINAIICARFVFQCADGTQAVVNVFAPSINIFLPDLTTVDITNAAVITFVAACVGTVESVTGSLATSLVSASIGPKPQGAG